MEAFANSLRKIRNIKAIFRKNVIKTLIIKGEMDDICSEFDSPFYLGHNPDVAENNIDPLEHYCRYGWHEKRDPNANFSTSYYLSMNPDVAKENINPFWHYIVAGRQEGRSALHPRGDKVTRLRSISPLETCVSRSIKPTFGDVLLNSAQLVTIVLNACTINRRRLVVSIGHDHYRQTTGGIQLCVNREEQLAPQFGAVYLNIHPWQPLPRLGHITDDPDPIMALVLDGQDVGFCRMSTLIDMVAKTHKSLSDIQFIIHHMLGHIPALIVELVQASAKKSCWLWLHDFFTICPSYTLQRNDISYCAAPDPASNACSLCKFGVERQAHLTQLDTFFKQLDVHLLSPSVVAKKFWQDHSNLKPASIKVVPHVKLTWQIADQENKDEPKAITVAFLGTAAPHKGWDIFENLAQMYKDCENFRFVFFGSTNFASENIDFTHVEVTAEDPDAMIRMVRENHVDFVLHWANWPETFSLSTYEALAGMAYVITNPISGNVATSVRKFRRGIVLNDKSELDSFLTSDRALGMVKSLRQIRQTKQTTYQLSEMAFAAFKWEKPAIIKAKKTKTSNRQVLQKGGSSR